MNAQLVSFLRQFVSLIATWLSDPQRVRFVLTLVVVCLILTALLIPALTVVANPIPGGVGH